MLKRNWMRKTGRAMSLIMTSVMSISMASTILVGSLPVKAAATVSNPRIADDGTVTWDKVTFGSYPQDATFEKEPIKWRILDIDENGNALLLADEALDCKPYNENGVVKIDSGGEIYTDYSCTWETCTLRDWLNGTGDYVHDSNAFINAAFTDDEKKAIINTIVVNDDNPDYHYPVYNSAGGNNTMDRVYLLSIDEVSSAAYGFDTEFKSNSKNKEAKATDYSCLIGSPRENSNENEGNCSWWLRSPGNNNRAAAYVSSYGSGSCSGIDVDDIKIAVRPALRINLASSYVRDAGRVTSNGNVLVSSNRNSSSQYGKPSTIEGITTWDCVYFGNYKQKASFVKSPIEWRVLYIKGNDAFIIADKAIDCKPYNEKGVIKTDSEGETYTDYSCTWETCTLRAWLNGTGDYADDNSAFIKDAFTNEEKNAIISTNVINENNPDSNTLGGSNTTDNIFLLSIGETFDNAYGFDANNDISGNITRKAKATDYVIIGGAGYDNSITYCSWWMRAPGYTANRAATVTYGGYGRIVGDLVIFNDIAVRPTLHVNLTSPYVKYAGTVSTESEVNNENTEAQKKADEVIKLISAIGTVTKDSKVAIDAARSAYDALSDEARNMVTNYSVLQAAETAYKELIKNDGGNGGSANNNGNKDGNNNGSEKNDGNGTGSNSSSTGEAPAIIETPSVTTSTEQTVTAPVKTQITFAKNSKKKAVVVKWKKVENAKGYELSYALNKKFTKSKKTKTITSSSKASFTVSKLKKGKTYYLRIRAYDKDSNGNKVYGKWSAVKKVKIKK